ncbi:hypothetical protein GOV12_07530 [Candidatus Pacearchaeota archaeon]|nr:hypothetical protein [Candidatus Pacearchaeota archaeon]
MTELNILHFSDFHGGYDSLDDLIEHANTSDNVDAVFFSGDILEQCLSTNEQGKMHNKERFMRRYAPNESDKPYSIDDLLKTCKKSKDKALKTVAREYEAIEKTFEKKAKTEYLKFREKIKGINKRVFMVPGNWDTPIFDKIFKKYSIHKKSKRFNGYKIMGFGGADSLPLANPSRKHYPYSDKEYQKQLKKHNPDIILSHIPPQGYADGKYQIGSLELGEYVSTNRFKGIWGYLKKHLDIFGWFSKNPQLVACGHAHGYDSVEKNKVTVVNAGSFGEYRAPASQPTFAKIQLRDTETNVKHYGIERGNISELEAPSYETAA